jgi:tetratricopeptide (TPR) repeat protein
MPSNIRALALLSLTIALAGSPQSRAAGEQWFIATNADAVVLSRDSDAAGRILAALTTARELMQQVAAIESLPPVRAFAVRGETSLRELVPQYWERSRARPHGASYTGPHTAFIAIRTDVPVAQQFPLVVHEYVHLVTAAQLPDAPAWLDEGLSEFWSGLKIDGQQIVIGRPPSNHLKLLRTRAWLPLHDMLEHQRGKLTGDQGRAEMFYAQSWAMVHYLLLGRSANAPSFAPPEKEVTPHLDAVIRAYATEGRFREVAISLTKPGGAPSAVKPVSEARALAERANMLVFGERPDAALPIVQRALSLDPREPLALEVMGTHYFLGNQADQARAWLTQAFKADPDSYSAALYLALLSSGSDRERYLQSAIRVRPAQAVAWQRLWAVYEEDGRGEQARRWCPQLGALLRSWLWVNPPLVCDGQGRR